MSQSFAFVDKTTNYALPLLFPGQTQKEFFVNQAFTMLDTLLQASVSASQSSPPPMPSEGQAYRIVSPANGEWSEHADFIALWIGGEWSFVPPVDGMRIYDRGASQILLYHAQWRSASPPTIPQGGGTVDAEARATLVEVVGILRELRLIPPAV